MAKKKPKTAKVAVEEEDAIPKPKLRRVHSEDDETELAAPKKRSDVFTGLAALSLLALIGAAVFFHLDHDETTQKSLAAPVVTVPAGGTVADAGSAPKGKTN